ncbi:MFS transporter [Nocardioides sp. YIM 152315]|uniref:MFS transporter n=1 Tax=Nocardioides sp. YIM 152315 TaxID=3031760 RepID=UPI0023DC231D|nr:MFS transporter [Nocardioides sp. YIM 152315]MDF1604510.1 MFS transporter [Nocardioides sp. YIM 152315]
MTGVQVAPSRPTAAALRPVTAVVAVMVSAAIPPFAVGAVAVQVGRAVNFSAADLGIGVAAYYLVSALLSPTGGALVVRFGPVACMRVATAAATLGIVAIATAPSGTVIVAALAVLGVPNAVVQPCANQVLVTIPARAQGLSFGLVQSAIPLSTLIAGALLALFGSGETWRVAMWVVVGITVLAQLVIGWARTTAAVHDDATAAPADLPALGGRPLLALLVVAAFAGSAAATTLPAFLASTGDDAGLAPGGIALAQVVGSTACAVTRIAVSHRAGSHPGPANLLTVAVLVLAGGAGFVLLSLSTVGGLVFGLGALLAYTCGWGWNGLFNLAITKARPGRVAATTGLTQGGIFLGGAAGPFLFSRLLEVGGYRLAWSTTAGIAVIAAASLTVAKQRWSRAVGLAEGAA